MTDDPARLSATDALARLRHGSLTSERLTEACLARITAREPIVHAWSHIDRDHALATARALDAVPAAERGPLHGLPIGIKDVLLTRDMPTQYGSKLCQGFAPAIDAAAVATLRAAGALILGKTETVEFAAVGAKPSTCNPVNPAHTPGGSSSGSAAAVADHHVPLALGTQTGGSIMRPASYCGAWAIKPTWGLVDRDGAKMFAASLDTIGWFGRSAADLMLLLETFDPDFAAPAPIALPGMRIAFCRTPMWDKAEAPTRHAFAEAWARLTAAGAIVSDLVLPPPFDDLARLHEAMMFGEGRATFLSAYRTFGDALDPVFRDMVDKGPGRALLLEAYDAAAAARVAFDAIAGDYDAVIVPSTAGSAPLGLANGGPFVFNGVWTMLHGPCVNVPGLVDATGMPVGLTVIGPRFADARVVAAAGAIGEAFSAT